MKTFQDILLTLNTDKETIEWVGDKKIEEVIAKCPEGSWLLWLAEKVDVPLQVIHSAKAKCMINMLKDFTDESAVKAVEVAVAFGEGRASEKQLRKAIDIFESTRSSHQMQNTSFYGFQSADICRKYIGELIIKKVNKLLNDNP